jgi:hypothetical protein
MACAVARSGGSGAGPVGIALPSTAASSSEDMIIAYSVTVR